MGAVCVKAKKKPTQPSSQAKMIAKEDVPTTPQDNKLQVGSEAQ